eukprot:TRINITY_DN16110_c0_g1::TRINITY_DN16110_c0_g1_i1::g.13684::m.13684 TRINITY_DN16110_c0_g1::TRINITY_DN16110_c0_g1_i1::g.13684  ORF type:complete len:583 (+),score=164.55,sp/Q7XPJ0/KN14I_ORYSJ/24.92/3e-11,FERM_M/PF00373.13/6.3e-11,PH/PF00169.24/8.2e-07,PH/PF00169.24/1.4e+04,PH_8/PF15409.1/0.0011,IRS/PF02174.12/3.2e+02,IRS/PF02174.12/3.7e+02,IRS/PF02174.12/0.057,RA/PF00788.18/0.0061,PH_11/PF15413.1/1,FERM_N/PF09379.5/0.14,PH_9/PF15410.1/0.3,PH_9/PF15410.1/6.3e+03 TRINITY_DN16110_c0_g1_i1:267-2015(+)
MLRTENEMLRIQLKGEPAEHTRILETDRSGILEKYRDGELPPIDDDNDTSSVTSVDDTHLDKITAENSLIHKDDDDEETDRFVDDYPADLMKPMMSIPHVQVTPRQELKRGWLKKEGHLLKGLKAAYYILTPESLTHYEDETCSEERGDMDLRYFIFGEVDRKHGLRFSLCSGDRVYWFEAESGKELQEWVESIQVAMAYQFKINRLITANQVAVDIAGMPQQMVSIIEDETTVDQLCDELVVRLRISRPEVFGLCEVWKKGDGSVYERVLKTNEIVSDIMLQWEKGARRMGFDETQADQCFGLVYKKIYVHIDDEDLQDPVEIELEYNQAVYDVNHGHVSVESDVFVLAAYQLHLEHLVLTNKEGPSLTAEELLTRSIERYLPRDYFRGNMSSKLLKKERKWCRDILAIRQDLCVNQAVSLTDVQVRKLYLQTIRQWPLYGSSFFVVESLSLNCGVPATQVLLGVHRTGVTILKKRTGKKPKNKDVYVTYGIDEIYKWGANDKLLQLTTGTPPDVNKTVGKFYGNFFFETEQGAEICDMIDTYARRAVAMFEELLRKKTGESIDDLDDTQRVQRYQGLVGK